MTLDIPGSFAKDLNVANHGILYEFIFQKLSFSHIMGIAVNPVDGLEYVIQVAWLRVKDPCSHRNGFQENLLSEFFRERLRS